MWRIWYVSGEAFEWNFQGTKTLLGEVESIFEEIEGKEKKAKTLLVPSIASKGRRK
ncbi:hypothetical protein MAL04_19990 (plasmid) [Leptospira noguchii]|nr:hypothetical protein MAL04_19990 [Leptospira noguchii]